VVVIRDLYKAFGELEVLKGVDLDLYREENLVVLGRSGTGKSVLIKIMVGLLQQDGGSMEVLGKEISKLGVRELNEMRLKIVFSFVIVVGFIKAAQTFVYYSISFLFLNLLNLFSLSISAIQLSASTIVTVS
jgi:ABC-type multidrug transport system ATPase subunit